MWFNCYELYNVLLCLSHNNQKNLATWQNLMEHSGSVDVCSSKFATYWQKKILNIALGFYGLHHHYDTGYYGFYAFVWNTLRWEDRFGITFRVDLCKSMYFRSDYVIYGKFKYRFYGYYQSIFIHLVCSKQLITIFFLEKNRMLNLFLRANNHVCITWYAYI